MVHELDEAFYSRGDVAQIAKELLGKHLISKANGIVTGGIIRETEAYAGETDRASHAFGGKRTNRTEIMYGRPGVAYVYLCYGIHHLFNVVTNALNTPHAVLIRAIQPDMGIETMLKRRRMSEEHAKPLAGGPGTLSKALGITTADTGVNLRGNRIWIEDRGMVVKEASIISGPRIGVDYAGKDAKLPYRFRISM